MVSRKGYKVLESEPLGLDRDAQVQDNVVVRAPGAARVRIDVRIRANASGDMHCVQQHTGRTFMLRVAWQ
jgi:hypothetical protein